MRINRLAVGLVGFLFVATVPSAQAGYEAVDLRTMRTADGYSPTDATAINNAGEIVGQAIKADADAREMAKNGGRAYLISAGQIRNLGVLSDKSFTISSALGLSETGIVVGAASNGNPIRPVFWERGGLPQDIPVKSDFPYASAKAVSSDGAWIIGSVRLAGDQQRTFVLHAGQLAIIEPIGADPKGRSFIDPQGVNKRGRVVGRSSCPTGLCSYVWQAGRLTVLAGLVPGAHVEEPTTARAIDDTGNVLGCSAIDEKTFVAVMWAPDGSVRRIGDSERPSGAGTCAQAINSHGVIVGTRYGDDHKRLAVRWDAAGGMHDLTEQTLLPPKTNRLEEAVSINDKGEILVMASVDTPYVKDMPAPMLLREAPDSAFYPRKYWFWIAGIAVVGLLGCIGLIIRRRL